MNVHYLLHHQIDKPAWDDCIENAENSLPFALSWYLDIVSPQWEAIVGTVGNQYAACFPIPIRKKLGMKYVCQPIFCQRLGLFYRDALTSNQVNDILQVLFQRYPYIPRFSFNQGNTFDLLATSTLRVKTYSTSVLSLNRTYNELYRSYKPDKRYQLRKANRAGLKVVSLDKFEPLVELFNHYIVPRIPGAYPSDIINRLYVAMKQRGKCQLFYTKNSDGELTSGSLIVFHKQRIIYFFSSASDDKRSQNGRTLIIDHIIRKYENTSYLLDFKDAEKEGVASFFARFGGEQIPYYHIYYNNLPKMIKQAHRVKIRAQRQLLRWIYPNRTLPEVRMP